jgi:hypothetical protein
MEYLHRTGAASTDHHLMKSVEKILDAYWHSGNFIDIPADVAINILDKGDADGLDGLIEETIKLTIELHYYKAIGDTAKVQELENDLQDSQLDPGWLDVVTEYLKFFIVDKKQVPYIAKPNAANNVIEALPANARVGIIADWGSGTEIARRVMRAMFQQNPDIIVHLGDIYFAGTVTEGQRNFLDILNAERAVHAAANPNAAPVPAYTLTGNHDMYSGGIGYYQLIKELNPAADFPGLAQPASFFSLQDAAGKWNLQCMDTGLNARDPLQLFDHQETYLESTEITWHQNLLNGFGGRTILLSHYQLFSAISVIGKAGEQGIPFNQALLNVFQPYFANQVAAWFWGHSHVLEIYEEYMGLAMGRCVGYSSIPEFLAQTPYAFADTVNPPVLTSIRPGDDGAAYNRGFTMLLLDDAAGSATVNYYQIANDPSYQSTLVHGEVIPAAT